MCIYLHLWALARLYCCKLCCTLYPFYCISHSVCGYFFLNPLLQIQLLKDLERHYIVMQEGCREVNQMYLIRGFFHLLPTFVLFGMQYFNLFLFNLPANMLTWHNIDRCFNVDQAADPEVIRKQLFKCKMYALFFFLSFFIYMYLWVSIRR